MRIEPWVELTNGRPINTDSAEFRERLPISAAMLDRMAEADDGVEGAFEMIGAIAEAVLALEARGVPFDD